MTELPPAEHDLHQRLLVDIASVVQPRWQEFEGFSQDPSVQEFCTFDSRYKDIKLDLQLQFMHFNPDAHAFTTEEVAAVLSQTHDRLDGFLHRIVNVYCTQKKKPLPKPGHDNEVGNIIARVLAGGVDKIFDYLGKFEGDDDTIDAMQYRHLA